MRFQMRIDPPWRPLLAAFGAYSGNSYVDVRDDRLDVHFGLLFHEAIPRADVASAHVTLWPLLAGIGWRVTLGRRAGLIGSREGVVEVRLTQPRRMSLAFVPWPWHFAALCVSLEEPEGFIAALAVPERTAG